MPNLLNIKYHILVHYYGNMTSSDSCCDNKYMLKAICTKMLLTFYTLLQQIGHDYLRDQATILKFSENLSNRIVLQ